MSATSAGQGRTVSARGLRTAAISATHAGASSWGAFWVCTWFSLDRRGGVLSPPEARRGGPVTAMWRRPVTGPL